MIANYNDPRVTLKQVYKGVTAGQTALLGACIIGPHYSVRTYQDFGDKLKMDSEYSTGDSDYKAKLLDSTKLDNVVPNTIKVFVQSPVIRKFSKLSGQVVSGNKLQIDLDAANTEQLLNLKTGWIVSITTQSTQGSSSATDYTVLAVSRKHDVMLVTLDKKATEGTVTFDIKYKATSGYLDKDCYSAVADTQSITLNITNATINGQAVVAGTLYSQYSEYNKSFVKKYGYCAGVDSVEDTLGKVCPQNPLAIAVEAACRNAGDNFVFFIAVDQKKIDNNQVTAADQYMRAADIVAQVAGCYGITPCTADKTVLQNLLGSANEMSAEQIPNFKYVYGSAQFDRSFIDDDEQDSDTAQMVSDVIDNKAFADKRGMLVIADNARYLGQLVPNYVVAAAIAGLRSNRAPQAPLSNVSLAGITTDDDSGFTYSQSKLLGANGFCRVGMNNGICIIRRQLTSAAVGDVNYDQQSIVCVIDAICLRLKTVGSSLVGNSNISKALIDLLRVDLTIALDGFTRQSDPYIGPMLLDATLEQLQQDPVDKARIICSISGQPPKPFNQFAITFYMN